MFEKIWYIKLEESIEGPYSIQQLRHHPRVTPDTLAKKKDWQVWRPIRYIYELRAVFEDAEPLLPKPKTTCADSPQGEAVLDMQGDFPHFFFWLFLLICLVVYFSYLQIGPK